MYAGVDGCGRVQDADVACMMGFMDVSGFKMLTPGKEVVFSTVYRSVYGANWSYGRGN